MAPCLNKGRRNKMRSGLAIFTVFTCMMTAPLSVMAEETDYSYLEDMSVKELRELDAAIHELLGNAGVAQAEEEITEAETDLAPVLMKEEDFFNDILESYSARDRVPDGDASEFNMMTNDEIVDYYKQFVEVERPFADKYKNAAFDDLNIQYLCKQYVNGVYKQLQACETYEKSAKGAEDYSFFDQNWHSGYSNRSYVIVELAEYYDIGFPVDAVAAMKEQVDALDSLNEAETRNAEVPHETVKEVQTLLHEIGFKCWNIDGVAGKRTVKAIKRFQEMYGFEIDGMIDDELIEQLKQVKSDKGLDVEPETETETETEQ